ncbi:23S rRNA (adenine(2503)-C(2))-methyltransferase RlmN [Calderihabitans maritimus]|uniref:Probable dual-specificity RNA methyltransferase RlmN n=1 Tax=Calderihabitans maritimus TaxID=1246530 RepID=A0A1Z5HPG4_9FIRM|nr:23S rRNA (adenine(2503)-C(2))-methyltransferase RlmN [Calderihabitans maritimus]GAW91422.1 hypothetical protein KKC1_05840 [Calderihabitans maritimus]
MEPTRDLRNLNLEEMEELVLKLHGKKYNARQLFQWVHQKGITDWGKMTNLPQKLIACLKEETEIGTLKPLERQVSRRDDTVKYLLGLSDGNAIETVLMTYTGREQRERYTVCLSTQVGCGVGCAFCATGQGGLVRNLEVAEIVGQVLNVELELRQKGQRVTNVVFMGMGEPLLNYHNVVKAIKILNHPLGLNIGWRRITVSTCGIVPKIKRLAREKMPLVLAVSLHAARDELRNWLVPVNRKYPLRDLLDACRYYVRETGRRITFEYVLIGGINDSERDARELASLLKGMLANVNVIPLNPIKETGFRKPVFKSVRNFMQMLEEEGIPAVLREEKGADIDAACGQLRGKLYS